MPKKKDLKRLTRARMKKTGEAYTSARAQLLDKTARSSPPPDLAKLAGMSDASVRAKTGRSWTEWVEALDAKRASTLSHPEIAKHLHEAFGLSGWWAQTVTVGYERIRGLREVGQRRDGAYEASKSKTFPVPLSKLYRAFRLARQRERWLPDVDVTVRNAIADKSMRVTWNDGTRVAFYFTAKTAQKSQVAVQHEKLASKSDVARSKAFWTERFAALGRFLEDAR